jgi:hypothetical protein
MRDHRRTARSPLGQRGAPPRSKWALGHASGSRSDRFRPRTERSNMRQSPCLVAQHAVVRSGRGGTPVVEFGGRVWSVRTPARRCRSAYASCVCRSWCPGVVAWRRRGGRLWMRWVDRPCGADPGGRVWPPRFTPAGQAVAERRTRPRRVPVRHPPLRAGRGPPPGPPRRPVPTRQAANQRRRELQGSARRTADH